MRLSTANLKNENYTERHEIYVGTHTGSFKRLEVFDENPHSQTNLQSISNLTKDSKITALDYGNEDQSEILIGRANKFVKVYDLNANNYTSSIELSDHPIVGLARFDGKLVAGFGTGAVQILDDDKPVALIAGDDMSRMRQCPFDAKLVATGGKNRQNNLKIFNLETMTPVFNSKNVPNDFLNLEVPVWHCDMAFLDANRISTCSRYGHVRFYDIRAQRRPVHSYTNEDQMSFSCLVAHDPYVYSGTTMGALKAFDTRNMKNFVHTYKGFTGSLSDLALDKSGKFLVSSSLDRYVRVHHVDSCALMYQCYVKSKATRILVRNADNLMATQSADDCMMLGEENTRDESDDEYNAIFEKMPTIKDTEKENAESVELPSKKRKATAKSKNSEKKKKFVCNNTK